MTANGGNVLIAGGRLVDPAADIDALRDVRIRNGVVVEIGQHLRSEDGETYVDASRCFVAPGFIDMHVHLREPGFPEKETIATGTRAAVRGGFTAVACMPNTEPSLDDPAIVRAVIAAAEDHGSCRVYPIAAITHGRLGKAMSDYRALVDAGAVAFSDDGATVENTELLVHAAKTSGVGAPFISHCEDEAIKNGGVMNEGATSRRMGVRGSPAIAEDVIVARDLAVALETGKHWHIAHLTTETGLDMVRAAKLQSRTITCEVTPHHLAFDDSLVATLGSAAKVNPPLRTQGDVSAMRQGVRDGSIDACASDHAPHTDAEKSLDLEHAAVGFSGLEVAAAALAYAIPDLPVRRFVEVLSGAPARILNLPGGTLSRGAPGDAVIFADDPWRVDPATFASKGHVTPFAGLVLPRRVCATIVAGAVQYLAQA
ncbi:MAG TPA: dihydroorotase [Candidatus Tumulicola sp.]